ncbi:MAG: PfkB family carbohydrate kinase, partial [Chloroflexota bacterium]|nr:PfkB family carbohydrate kinase [Chloroflexota bacterium]
MIAVVGSANMDLITSVVELPRPGETVLGSSLMRAAGGKGANQAVAAARAGGEVAFVGRVGDDESGSTLLQALQAAGVGTNHVVIDKGHPTGLALITVNDQGENTIVVVSGANGEVSSADVERASAALRASSYLVMQLEIPLEAVAHAADSAARLTVKVILNAAPARPLPTSLLEQV